jgi:hypothetical protein
LRKWASLVGLTPIGKRFRLAQAWKNLQRGNGKVEDFELIVADLVDVTGYYRRPNYSDWLKRTKTPEGFELHSALSNARAEVVQHIMGFLTLDDDALIALERAARNEGQQ